ncbi:MAG: M48 family metallopeptidase [Planctomycetota bacterium]|jgi:predicted Zn-dependent protease
MTFHWLTRPLLSLALCLVLTGCLTQEVPVTGRQQLSLVSASNLNSMGFSQYASFLKKSKLSTDSQKTAMVKRCGLRIQRAVEEYLHQQQQQQVVEGYRWEFNLIEDKQPNAFCMPGGKVAIFTGILPITQTESGLAVVMAHEIAHAIAQHSRERMSQQLVAAGLGVVLGQMTKNQEAKKRRLFLGLYGVGAQVGFMLPNNRLQENEADHLGLIFMAMAGYDPRVAIPFWQRMAAKGGARPPAFLSTHPTDQQRVTSIQRLMPRALQIYQGKGAQPAVPVSQPLKAPPKPESEIDRLRRENEKLRQALDQGR